MSPLAALAPGAALVKKAGPLALLSPAAAIATKLGGKKNKDKVSSTPVQAGASY